MPRNKKEMCEKYNSAFASRLRQAFEEGKSAGLTQAKLAAQLGVSAQAVSKWYNGENEPQLSFLPQIADYFGTSTDWLLGKEIPKAPDITNRVICEKTGLSGTAVDNLTMMARTSGGDDFWSFSLRYVSFLLETYYPSLITPSDYASAYIENHLSIKYCNDVYLPKLTLSQEARKNPFSASEEDLDVWAATNRAQWEINKLKDVCAAKRYYCEKAASAAASAFIDQITKQSETNPPQWAWTAAQHHKKNQAE